MKWEGREESRNVQDRRRIGPKGIAIGGGSAILLLIAVCCLGLRDPQQLMRLLEQQAQQGQQGQRTRLDPEEEELASFTKVVFRDTEVVWEDQFHKLGREYKKPTLVLYSGQVNSACGAADSGVGPFYCPGDESVYIDLSFYKDMTRDLGAPGEFARAYVIAHEVGHHVQRLLGFSEQVDEARRRRSPQANQMSVRLELQADYLAGVWAHYGQKEFRFLEPGDLESAIKAAYEIGDDRLQRRSRGFVTPHSYTHGTSAQRTRWFKAGFQSGDVRGAKRLFDLDYEDL